MWRTCWTVACVILLLVATNCGQETPTTPGSASALALGPSASPLPQAHGNPEVIPPHARPGGRTYAEWSAAWWQWLWAAPVPVNPGLDETGEFVDYGQSGSVWFIAPNYGGVSERFATIPTGKMLFIDVAADFEATAIGSGNEEEMRAIAAWVIDNIVSARVEVDGVPIENLDDYRVLSPLFSYTVPENNMFELLLGQPFPAGTYYPGVSDGYFLMLAPLSAGEHTIYIAVEFGEPYNMESIVTLHLTVSGHAH